MGFQHRKILPQIKIDGDDCEKACKLLCSKKPGEDCPFPPPPPPSPLSNHVVGKSLILSGSLIGGFLLLFVVFLIMKRYFSRRNSSTERNLPILFDIQQDFVDDDHGPVIDHHIWFINTVGLPQSVIDSITACEYRKEEGLIEGTECSVCLSEFEEGESVRLLPKCSHAFHLSCIDTWLRSHKNCPLCRAPIVRDVAAHSTPQASVTEPNSNDFRSLEDTQLENSENHGGQLSHEVDEGGTSEVSVRVDVGEIELEYARNAANRIKGLSNAAVRSCDSRALSDLVDKREVVGKEIEPMRRSVSMDASSAVAIYRAVANVVSDQGSSNSVSDQGSSNSQLAVPMKSSNLAIVSKRVTQNLSLYKFMRSSSIGRSLQKGPTSMKRSYSSSRKSLSSKHGRSHSSILPS